jgi:hypothetical protein
MFSSISEGKMSLVAGWPDDLLPDARVNLAPYGVSSTSSRGASALHRCVPTFSYSISGQLSQKIEQRKIVAFIF